MKTKFSPTNLVGDKNKKVLQEISSLYIKGKDLESAKRKAAKKFGMATMPKKFEVLDYLKRQNIELSIKEKIHSMRSLSGIVSVTVLTKPYPCHFRCAYCPKEKGMPQSYLSSEPAAARAKMLNFDPYLQVKKRLKVLEIGGHPTDKIELIILGGSFSLYPNKYRQWFLKCCFDAANNKKSKNLKEAQKINETTQRRIIGVTIETRPDLIDEQEIKFLRYLGVTRVEIGAQNYFDFILKKNHRGHKKSDLAKATYLLKEAGFKVTYHLMLNLPGSNPFLDWLSCLLFFYNPRFRPDQVKIYPLMVVKGSLVYEWFKAGLPANASVARRAGKFKTYDTETLIRTLAAIKRYVPNYVRIVRIIRDIPAKNIESGSKFSNLREDVQKFMNEKGIKCNCVRCREIKNEIIENPKLLVKKYRASKGIEYFLSIVDKKKNKLGAFLRLRILFYLKDKEKPIFRVLKKSAIIREIHTYGRMLSFGRKSVLASQHQGFGKILIKEAEKIAKKQGAKDMAVIAGIGAREYFRKFGYELRDDYMIKKIKI